jgi:hypothetical protein
LERRSTDIIVYGMQKKQRLKKKQRSEMGKTKKSNEEIGFCDESVRDAPV